MAGRVQGKVALITGAARGQGRAHAVRLAEEGASIIAVDICAPIEHVGYAAATPADLDETIAAVTAVGGRIHAETVDIRDGAALGAACAAGVRGFGGLDIVVANAGVFIGGPWDEITADAFRTAIDVNVTGTWNTIMAGAPHLVTRGGGSIVLVSSAAGLKGLPFMNPYVASKHALTGLAKAFAHELAQHRIRVNSVHPGGVDTVMGTGEATAFFGPALEANPRVGGMLQTSFPDPMTSPRDQANAVLFLASDEAAFVTALAMTVDAGNATF
jgi:SDR family mycofactocin-dependent oxidoreductase